MPDKNKGGRPTKEFDKDLFERLCGIMCTRDEICDIFNTTNKTLDAWCKRTYGMGFSPIYEKKTSVGKMSLRRAQFKLAEKSAAMAIFLGKNYLGQSDRVEHAVATENEIDPLSKAFEVLGDV